MPFFAIQYSGMQKMASFLLTGMFGAPPRRAAKFVSENDVIFCNPILSIPNFKEIENWENDIVFPIFNFFEIGN